jgi:spermidine/putrescine transport system substrate-binding protein
LWETDLKASAKDSIRDTYVVGVMYYYRDELRQNREVYLEAKETYDAHFEDYQNGLISENEYKAFYDEFKLKQDIYRKSCGEIMNRCDDETIKHVEEVLVEMKDNIYSFEVDNGKNDIVTGKISLNFAWSGDAVYSMDVAEEEEGVNLYYSVPEEGSNVWFDGWVMPKGANVELAQSFVNYLCSEEIAIRNMDFIGYTSSVVGDEILNRIDENYGVEEGEEGYDVDLTYLFGNHVSDDKKDENGRVIVTVSERGRQFDAQYPDEEVISRCGIMEDFGDQYSKVLALWENVKIGHISPIANIIVIVGIVLMVAFVYGSKLYRNYIRRTRKEKFRVTE